MGYFAILDCNNFYASCERLFNPSLEGKPIVVLSNNDGCVISRSQEAKQLKIQMGVPYYQIKDFCTFHKVHVFSSNYRLYGDLSRRVMSILMDTGLDVEVYSIDEAFMQFSDAISEKSASDFCFELRQKIKKWVGIPTAIGLAPTKTLAKLANEQAKKSGQGVFSLCCSTVRKEILHSSPIEEVWGIGRNNRVKLNRAGIYTVQQLCDQDPLLIRRLMSVVGERMLWELRGISCLAIENEFVPKQSITCSRCFGKRVSDFDELAEALSSFTNTACIKLREQGSFAQGFYIFIESVIDPQTSRGRYYSYGAQFSCATQDTTAVINLAKQCLRHIYRKTEVYRKCGIVLLDLIQEREIVSDLFKQGPDPKRIQLMDTFDAINAHYGKNSVFFAAMGVNQGWKMRSEKKSGDCTTNWSGLATVKC